MKHTKGPWLFDGHENVPRDNGTYALGANISNLEGKNIATVMISGPWIDDVSEAEGNANYHLIAAAPEMLEALEIVDAVLNNADVVELKDGRKGILYFFEATDMSQIKNAIKKAKG